MKDIKKRLPLKLNLQMFADPDPDPNPNPNPNPDPDPNKGKTFTQAELDQQIQSRLGRAEKAAQKTLAVSLGFDSVEAMQAALKKPDPKKDEPVDVDKLVDEKLKAKEKEQNDKTFKRLVASEVKVLANELGFADWEDAHALADLTKVTEDEKGNITGVKEALEELLKKKPHLGKSKPGSGGFGSNVPNSQEQKAKSLEAIKKLAQNEGTHVVAANDPWVKK
jgi:hypothetical protein